MSVQADGGFAFIAVDGAGKTRTKDRGFIRSYCMRGKNRRIGVSVGPSGKKVMPPRNRYHSVIHEKPTTRVSSRDKAVSSDMPTQLDTSESKDSSLHKVPGELDALRSQVPPAPPSDLLLWRLPCEINTTSRKVLHHYLVGMQEELYPIELCVDFDLGKSHWFKWLFTDAAYLNCALFTTSAMHDMLSRKPTSKATLLHMKDTISYLNRSLFDTAHSIQDSTIAVVISLSLISGVIGDIPTAKTHVAGLQRMIRIRGGLNAFQHNPKLLIKLGRIDLAYSMKTGEDSVFPPPDITWTPIIGTLGLLHAAWEYYDPVVYGIKDLRLASVFKDLQYYTRILNEARVPGLRRSDVEYQAVISSVQHRLLQLQGTLNDIHSECVRLALLALLTTTFQLHGRRMRYPYLADRFRECYCALEASTPELRGMMLWLLVVGTMSVYSSDEPWLRERRVADVPELSWDEARRRLKGIIWIDAIHDVPGRQAYRQLGIQEMY
ncbi:hypothetical protein BX600DRAFT_146448 [Xylariales sp. PMI_506]|nr:hypothetical protein BX600DRAFT_146448 [Xylariales sp. PMI_506]